MRRVLSGAACAVVFAVPATAQQVRTVTLDEALRLAIAAQPTMVSARQQIRLAESQRRQSLGAFLPSITGTSAASKSGVRINATTGEPVPGSVPYNTSFGVNMNMELFTGFRRGADRRSAEATLDQREAALTRTEFEVALATKRAFFTALANAELVTVQETRLRAADEQLKLTSERLRLGATTRSDSLRARVSYGNAQLALITAQNNLRVSQANLARVIQVEGLVMPVADSSIAIRRVPLDTANLRGDALANAPAVREAASSVDAARAVSRARRAAYLPSLNASFTPRWARAGNDVFGSGFTHSWTFQVGMNYPLFDRFQRELSVTTADVNVQNAIANQRDARLLLDANLTTQLSALDAAAASIDVTTVSVTAAEEDLRMQRERYRLGAATILEVLTSQSTLDQARVDLVNARYNYLTAKAQVEALVGRSL